MPKWIVLTFKQWCVNKRRITQAQRADIPHIEKAREIVHQMIRETLEVSREEFVRIEHGGLLKEDIDRLFNSQPVHFDDEGYTAHWFSRWDIERMGFRIFEQMKREMKRVTPNDAHKRGMSGQD